MTRRDFVNQSSDMSIVQYVRKFVNQSLVQTHVGWKFMELIKFLSLYQGVNKWSIFFNVHVFFSSNFDIFCHFSRNALVLFS